MSDQGPEYPTYPGNDDEPGSAPPPPPGGSAPAVAEQPGSIALAVKLMWAGAALSLLSVLVSFLMLDSLRETVEESILDADPDATQAMMDTAFTVSVVMTIVFGLLAVGLWCWMAWKNGQGRSWARIVATVLAGVNVLFSLGSFTQPGTTPITTTITLVNLALAVTILVLLWKKESTAFYTAVTESQRLR